MNKLTLALALVCLAAPSFADSQVTARSIESQSLLAYADTSSAQKAARSSKRAVKANADFEADDFHIAYSKKIDADLQAKLEEKLIANLDQ